jgi:hypothetical protein
MNPLNKAEIEKMMAKFEKDLNQLNAPGLRTDHEENAPYGYFYQHGQTNWLFRAYLLGFKAAENERNPNT